MDTASDMQPGPALDRAVAEAMGWAMASGAEQLVGFVGREGLKSFASEELLVAIKNQILFAHPLGGGTAFGYETTILADRGRAAGEGCAEASRDAGGWQMPHAMSLLVLAVKRWRDGQ